MNLNIHTLTAYKITFDYIRRNNPLKEELSSDIKEGKKPTLKMQSVLDELIKCSIDENYSLLSSDGKVILLPQVTSTSIIGKDKTRITIIPYAGKRDVPTRMVNLVEKKKVYNFGADWSSTYGHYVFIYICGDEIYAVFHRKGGSGCKTLFNNAINQILKPSGIKMNMAWLIPPAQQDEDEDNYTFEKVILRYEEGKTGDIADELDKKKKKAITIKEISLNLKSGRFSGITQILNRYRLKEIEKADALSQMAQDAGDFKECNNAKVTVRIGKTRRIIEWDDFENLISGYDITDKLKSLGGQFSDALTQCSDEFICSIMDEDA